MAENKVLFVDDEDGIRTVFRIALSDMGYDVLTAANGEAALAAFKAVRPPIVLTDIKMPGMDGIELLRKIKEIAPDTEVIMVTGHGDLELAIKSIKYQATDFITKPIDVDVLQIALKRASEKILMRRRMKDYHANKAMCDVIINELLQEEIMIIAPDYSIMDINETMLKKFGLKREEVIGRPCYRISHHQDTPCEGDQHPCPLGETFRTKKPSQATHLHRDKEGRELYYSISCYPIYESGQIIGVIEISKDITKDINLQKGMMQQQKLASIGQLAAGVAHEINNPMTTILTTALLIQEELDPDDPNYGELQTISNEALRCRKIVASLLDFARQTRPTKKENDINKIVTDSLLLIRKQAAFNDVCIHQDLSGELPPLKVDGDQIQQALINLALNAIEATEPGGTVSFMTRFQPKEKAVEITVRDTGVGIPKEDLEKIYEPFFTTKETGTGLGMAVTHGLITQHRGVIGVTSKVGEGTTFVIRLPIDEGDPDGD